MSGSSPCAACHKRCCSHYTVSITGRDAWEIEKGLHLPLESFLVYFPVENGNGKGFILESKGPRCEIALDKAGKYENGSPCVFWMELSNECGRCGIYPYRPMVCKTYPAYQTLETVVLRDDVICPPGSWNLVGIELPVFRRLLSRFRMDRDIHAYVVGGWNAMVERKHRVFSIREYYASTMNIYDRIDTLERKVGSDEWNDVARMWGDMSSDAPNPLFADTANHTDGSHCGAFIRALRDCIGSAVPWWVESEERVVATA